MSFLFEKSKIEKWIEELTAESQSEPNVSAIMQLIDALNAQPTIHKEAIKVIKKRLGLFKFPRVQFYTLALYEMCMKNCNSSIQLQLAHKDLLDILYKLCSTKLARASTSLFDIQQKEAVEAARTLVETLSTAFNPAQSGSLDADASHAPSHQSAQGQGVYIPEFAQLYTRLKVKDGVEFPARDMSSMAPVFTPPAHPQPSAQAPPQSQSQSASPAQRQRGMYEQSAPSASPLPPLVVPAFDPALYEQYCSVTPAYVAKLYKDLTLVYDNVGVYLDLLAVLGAAIGSDPSGAVLAAQFSQFQSRLSLLVVELTDERLVDVSIQSLENVMAVQRYAGAVRGNRSEPVPKIHRPAALQGGEQEFIRHVLGEKGNVQQQRRDEAESKEGIATHG